MDKHRPSSSWARRYWKRKPVPPPPKSSALRRCFHALYTAFASAHNGKYMDYRELICAMKYVQAAAAGA